MENIIKLEILEHKKVFDDMDLLLQDIQKSANMLLDSINNNKKIILFGNGGSASDANHISAEIVGRYKKDITIPAISLSSNTSIITSIANDYGYCSIFSQQLKSIANKDDCIIAISTSGNSKNVIKAIKQAKKQGLKIIGLTGKNGGDMKKLCDICICINSDNTPRIQEAHIFIGHLLCEIIDANY